MFRRSTLLAVTFALIAACGSKKDKDTGSTGSAATGSAQTGSAATGSGSDTGSAAAGSGSDTGSAAAGSGSDAGSAAAGSGSDAGSAAAGSGADVPFEKLSHEDKVKFMKTKVMPTMKAAFQKFDPKEFANFTCKTCHGKDPQGSKHKMPTADLPKLDFKALEKGEDAEEAKFMAEVVKPTMAKLLGEPEQSETVQDGFGCLDCHMQKK